ncbi:DUF6318 family protein [Actinomyces sp. MRS3W]|uniref:DUF6318 family protein n=1 Tax=Actinomyces sp. MRS3W TaxID=2800796 RepID=UPI0028FD2332|nr:DUF6318 family protein [Actinomyces sp. MRS3W]MDU0348789.1 DUF6318 family protein [Actinomyces sp. MRS3W]
MAPRGGVPIRPSHGRHPNRAARAAVLAACLTLLTAGCSGNGNTTGTPTATAAGGTPTVSTSPTPSASQTPSLSPEDAAARATALAMEPPDSYTPEFTPDGAANAATYFLNLFPYMYATGDLDAWKDMSEDDCEFCNNALDDAAELHDAGGWADPWEQEITPLEWWTDEADPNRYVVRVNVVSQAHSEHPGGDTPSRTVEKSEGALLIQMYWEDRDWKIEAGEAE